MRRKPEEHVSPFRLNAIRGRLDNDRCQIIEVLLRHLDSLYGGGSGDSI